jgi:hypothetical protein
MELLSVNTTNFFVHVGFMVDRVALGQALCRVILPVLRIYALKAGTSGVSRNTGLPHVAFRISECHN